MEDGSKTNSPAQATTPASGDDTDISPPVPDQVTESGTSDFAEQWLELKCVFCGQELKDTHEPKLLQCLHTACKSCLTSESGLTSPAPSSSGLGKKFKTVKVPPGRNYRGTPSGLSVRQLVCPSCNQEVNTNDIVDHLFLLEHLSQNSEGLPEESKSYPCSCEEGADATGFCTDCQEWLCDACVTAHHRVRVTKDHIIRPKEEMEGERPPTGLSQKYLFCPVHSHEPLKLYCESCDKLTCRDCQLSDHKEHKYQFLSNACEEEKNSLNLILAKIKEKQHHIESACSLVNKRHQEITERELAVTQEIKTFAVKFITEINKRGKQLLQELSDVCTNKKTQLSYKHQELLNMGQKLSYCQKFSESALAHGSETALVYSKKIIIGQLKRILKHRCEVPNPQHNVDITFSYEDKYLTQYISQLGTLLVDQQPVPRVPLVSSTQPQQQQQQPQQQPAPRAMQQQPVHQNTQNVPLARQVNTQQLVPVNRNSSALAQHLSPQQQQMQMQQQKQQQLQIQQKQQQQLQLQKQQQMAKHPQQQQSQQQGHYGQPQVTSSTDPAQNRSAQQGNMRQMMNTNTQMATYSRNHQQQRNMQANVNQNQNYAVSSNSNFMQQQRHITPQPSPVRQPAQQSNFNQPVSLPMPLMQNSNITISAIPGPTPPKQRAMAPRQNIQLSPISNQQNIMQRMGNSQQNLNQQQQRGQTQQRSTNQPQVIVIDGDGPSQQQKTPTMSNTSRLTHFPAAAAAAMSANPGLQIQPVGFHNNTDSSISTQPVSLPEINVPQSNWSVSVQSSSLLQSGGTIQMDCRTSTTNDISPHDAVTSLDKFTDEVIGSITCNSEPDQPMQDDVPPTADSTLSPQLPKNPDVLAVSHGNSSDQKKLVITSKVKPEHNLGKDKNLLSRHGPSHLKKKSVSIEKHQVRKLSKQPNASSVFSNSGPSCVGDDHSKASSSNIDKPVAESKTAEQIKSNIPAESKPGHSKTDSFTSTPVRGVRGRPRKSLSSDQKDMLGSETRTIATRCSNKNKRFNFDLDSDSDSSDELPSLEDILKCPQKPKPTSDIETPKPASPVENSEISNRKSNSEEGADSVGENVDNNEDDEKNDPNEDYCAVCHDGGELLCCSNCPRVYHFRCHVPGISEVPNNDWLCRMCENLQPVSLDDQNNQKKRKLIGLSDTEIKLCERILLELYCHKNSAPFHMKISKNTPGYYAMIKKPMDMSLIRIKLTPTFFEPYRCVKDFISDVKLMFSNCTTYNGEGSILYEIAKNLEEFFEDLLKTYFPMYVNENSSDENDEKLDSSEAL